MFKSRVGQTLFVSGKSLEAVVDFFLRILLALPGLFAGHLKTILDNSRVSSAQGTLIERKAQYG